MSTDKTPTRYTALCVPVTTQLWEEESSYSETGPRAGVPEDQAGDGASKLSIEARGVQDVLDLEVRTQRGGFAARAAEYDVVGTVRMDTGAAFVWRSVDRSGPVYSEWRGWDPPRNVTRWVGVIAADGSTFPFIYARHPHAVVLSSGVVLAAVHVYDQGEALPYQIAVYMRSGASDTWTRLSSPYGEASAPASDYCPTICVLPTGRVLLFHVLSNSTYGQVAGWFSDDDGVTWSLLGDNLTGEPFLSAITRLRVAYKAEQLCFLASDASGTIYQYAGSDNGNSLDFVSLNVTHTPSSFDLTVSNRGFVLVTAGSASTISVTLGSAYTSIDAGAGASVYSSATAAVAVTTDETGVLWAYLRPSNSILARFSVDGGTSWTPYANASGATTNYSATCYPSGYCAVAVQGAVLMLGGWQAPSSATGVSLGCWTFGGYTTLCFPRRTRGATVAALQSWTKNWNPLELPGNVGWTKVTTGTATESVTTGNRLVITTGGDTLYYRIAPTTTSAVGLMASFTTSTQVGAALSVAQSALIRLDDGGGGTPQTAVRVEWAVTSWRLMDDLAGTQIGATQSFSFGAHVEVIVAVAGRVVRTWWRVESTTAESGVRDYTVGPTTSTLTQGATAGVGDRIEWGHRSAGTRTSSWWDVKYADSADIVSSLVTGQTNPTDLQGRAWASALNGVYIGQGVTARAKGGPTYIGDTWSINRRYDFGIERAITNPSPRQQWVASSTTASVALRWDDDASLGVNHVCSLGMVAIALLNCNVELIDIDVWVAGAWVTIANVDRREGLKGDVSGLAFDALDNRIRPGARDGEFFARYGEFTGSWFMDENGTQVEILGNTEGRWDDAAAVRPVLLMDGTSILQGAGNNEGAIVPKDTVICLDLSEYEAAGIRLNLTNANAAICAGVARVYRLIPLGRRPDWGRAVDLDTGGVELAESRDRTRRARAAAPPRRSVDVSWVDTAIDQTNADRDGDPDYVRASDVAGTRTAAGVDSTAYTVEGIAREVEGSTRPILYLPAVPVQGTPVVLNRRHQLLYARLATGVSIESVLGDEDEDELVRVATVTLEEEL